MNLTSENRKAPIKDSDLASYGETLIKLSDQTSIRIKNADIDMIRYQRDQLIQDHIRHIQAFITQHDEYVMPILESMESWGFETAGQAIAFLIHKDQTDKLFKKA